MLNNQVISSSQAKYKPYKIADGGGMYLLVKSSGKYFRWDYRFGGKRKTIALGVYPSVSLDQARKKHSSLGALLNRGIDPMIEKRREKFHQAKDKLGQIKRAAYELLLEKDPGWVSPHTSDELRFIEETVIPILENAVSPTGDFPTIDFSRLFENNASKVPPELQEIICRVGKEIIERLDRCSTHVNESKRKRRNNKNPVNSTITGIKNPAQLPISSIKAQLAPLNREDERPLYIQIADSIAAFIINNRLLAGSPLPSEKDLMERFKVSRITVRSAIQRLSTEGLVNSIHGKGVYVSEQRYDFTENNASIEAQSEYPETSLENGLIEASVFHPAKYYLKELHLGSQAKTFKLKRVQSVNGVPLCIDIKHLPLEIAGRYRLAEFEQVKMTELLARYSDTVIHQIDYRIRGEQLFEKNTDFLKASPGTATIVQLATYYNTPDRPVMAGKRIYLATKTDLHFKVHRNGRQNDHIVF